MVSSAGRRIQSNGVGRRSRLTSLYRSAQLICILLIFAVSSSVYAQIQNTLVELVSQTGDEVTVHVRVPRGQSIASAQITQGDATVSLETDTIPLPVTQFIVLDAGDAMVNLQSVVQDNVGRFWRNSDNLTGLLFYDSDVDTLLPTSETTFIDDRLAEYTTTAGEPSCLGEAIAEINAISRNLDRSWRILVVTAGDLSRQANCDITELANLPAPVDVIAITDTIEPTLQDLVDRSGGEIYSANLRSVELRANEVRTLWGQPTYALSATVPDGWDSATPFDLTVELSNGTEETTTITALDYNLPVVTQPTAEPTEVVLATIPPNTPVPTAETVATEVVAVAVDTTDQPAQTPSTTSPDGNTNNVALGLIIGAILFVIGAVVLALALSRMQRAPARNNPNQSNQSYYETLINDDAEVEEAVVATRIRERGIVGDEDGPVTQIADAPSNATTNLDNAIVDTGEDVGDEDELLVTQVLTDDRFRDMMRNSRTDEDIVGWMRLMVEGEDPNDFALTAKGALIGRSQECDIQIIGDRAISRKHARLDVRDNQQVTISRLSTVNPVMVGTVQVTNRHQLAPNDVIHLSDTTQLIFIANNDETEFDDEVTQF